MCEGYSLEIGMAFRGSVVRREIGQQPPTWIASINSTGLGEFLERAPWRQTLSRTGISLPPHRCSLPFDPSMANGPKMMKWGLIPHWAKDDKLQYSTFNARAEDFTTKPAFRDAWTRGQRCLVVTDGFYEWKKLDAKRKLKQPYAIATADNDAQMVMAGLWAKWKSPSSGEEVLSCTILTCGPNRVMGELHDRMPVILADKDWPKWLGEEPGVSRIYWRCSNRALTRRCRFGQSTRWWAT